jgi:hypothetical protein
MKKCFLWILKFLILSAVIYFSIATVLVLVGKRKTPSPDEGGLAFNELFFDYASLPELKSFTARDGTQLAYRHYPADSEKIVIQGLSPRVYGETVQTKLPGRVP